jgi:hypothetical protein
VIRRVTRKITRTLIPYRGPSFKSILALLGACYRMSVTWHERLDPAFQKSRFKCLCTPEEGTRQMLRDLDRIYGHHPDPSSAPPNPSAPPDAAALPSPLMPSHAAPG